MIKNERLKDIGLRHGKDSTAYKNSEKMIDWLKNIMTKILILKKYWIKNDLKYEFWIIFLYKNKNKKIKKIYNSLKEKIND